MTMCLILIILTYHANLFGAHSELFESSKNISVPTHTNIENLDIKQLKAIVNDQDQIIQKQKEVIDNHIDRHIENIKKNRRRFTENIVKPDENIDKYFKELRDIDDKKLDNKEYESEEDIIEKNKKMIKVVKRYLEDPVMRGYNIYESEQYSKLLEIGNIYIDEKISHPEPSYWSKNINSK